MGTNAVDVKRVDYVLAGNVQNIKPYAGFAFDTFPAGVCL